MREKRLVRSSKPKDGTTKFFTFATLAVVHKSRRVTVAFTLVRYGESAACLVKRLLKIGRKLGVKIKTSYWDKAFGTIEVMRYLMAHRVSFRNRACKARREWNQ
jgi:putative transposase